MCDYIDIYYEDCEDEHEIVGTRIEFCEKYHAPETRGQVCPRGAQNTGYK